MQQDVPSVVSGLAPFRRAALVAGVAGAVALIAGGLADRAQFFQSYLLGFLYWLGIGAGSLAILMIYHLTGGAWGAIIRRVLEAATRTLPLLALLFVPLVFGLHDLYHWTHTDEMMADAVLRRKTAYLNVPFFLARAAAYFVVWSALALLLNRWSRRQDERADPALIDRMRKLSGGGILLWGLATTFASFDWIMSLDPHWFSTIFGVLVAGGWGLSTLAFAIVSMRMLSRRGLVGDIFRPSYVNDLGSLLFAFVMLWAYIAVSQLIIVWSGNLPEEIPWYLTRLDRGWQWVALLLVLGHFVLPFLLLLSRDLKRRHGMLAWVAGGVVLARLLDLFWLVGPELHGGPGLAVHWLDVAAPLAVGGLWLALFARLLAGRPLLPPGEPELASAGSH